MLYYCYFAINKSSLLCQADQFVVKLRPRLSQTELCSDKNRRGTGNYGGIGCSEGAAMPYGNDECSQRLEAKFSDLFETAVTVFQ